MKKKKQNKMALKLLWYYLAILIVPTITTTIIYFTTRAALLEVQKEKAYISLTDTVNRFEQDMVGIKNIATYLSLNSEVIEISRNTTLEQNVIYYNMYKSCSEFPKYVMNNTLIDETGIWFSNQPYIIMGAQVIPKMQRGMDSIVCLQGEDVDALEDIFCKDYHYMQMNVGGDFSLNSTKLRLVHSISSSSGNQYDGAIVISLNNNKLNQLLKNMRLNSDSNVFLLDEKGMILRCFSDEETLKLFSNQNLSWEEYVEKSKITDDAYVYQKTSDCIGWTFVVVTSIADLTKNIGVVKYFMELLYIISIVTGGLICLYYWNKNKTMVNRYWEYTQSFSMLQQDEKRNQGFWNSFSLFLDQFENIQITFNRQKKIVELESVRKLIQGKYNSEAELREENEEFEKALKAYSGYYISVIRVEKQIGWENVLSDGKLCDWIKSLLYTNLNIPYWLYPLDEMTYVIILADEKNYSVFDIEDALSSINKQSEESVSMFIGISQKVSTLMKIAEGFEMALISCKSASFFQNHLPVIYEVKENHNKKITIESEFQIQQVLMHGTENDLETVLISLRENNMEHLQHWYWIQTMIYMLQGVLVNCFKQQEDDWSKQMVIRSQNAQWPDELFLLCRTAKRYQIKIEGIKKDSQFEERKVKIEEMVQKEYSNDNFTLSILAEEIGMTEQKLYKEFKNYFGVTFSDYLENVRMNQAIYLLRQGVAVKDVACMVGYGSDYSFRRAFKRNTGMTPSSYLKN